jgi:hypothetical protein
VRHENIQAQEVNKSLFLGILWAKLVWQSIECLERSQFTLLSYEDNLCLFEKPTLIAIKMLLMKTKGYFNYDDLKRHLHYSASLWLSVFSFAIIMKITRTNPIQSFLYLLIKYIPDRIAYVRGVWLFGCCRRRELELYPKSLRKYLSEKMKG